MSDTDDEFDQTPATSTSDDEGKLDLKDAASKAITFLKTKSPEIFDKLEGLYWDMLRLVKRSEVPYVRSELPACAVAEAQIVFRNIWAGEAVAPESWGQARPPELEGLRHALCYSPAGHPDQLCSRIISKDERNAKVTEKYGHMKPGEGASICFLLHILLHSPDTFEEDLFEGLVEEQVDAVAEDKIHQGLSAS
ncbi:hypothetical protein C8Q70DRAFT_1056341 [Cubamyces menziesii]|uniref:Uncharacterized protein n=1 Tax=Trametes cubensis TaxID=1111947 RepID=A0AAD7U580_9APHY|nr:hypothetical protein C8Q70DRAFT_1056341 [Cubamyces menziesii]KAJ8497127.1 hypothetical protein ONZ51_g668 [Trametes cubensis]